MKIFKWAMCWLTTRHTNQRPRGLERYETPVQTPYGVHMGVDVYVVRECKTCGYFSVKLFTQYLKTDLT